MKNKSRLTVWRCKQNNDVSRESQETISRRSQVKNVLREVAQGNTVLLGGQVKRD